MNIITKPNGELLIQVPTGTTKASLFSIRDEATTAGYQIVGQVLRNGKRYLQVKEKKTIQDRIANLEEMRTAIKNIRAEMKEATTTAQKVAIFEKVIALLSGEEETK